MLASETENEKNRIMSTCLCECVYVRGRQKTENRERNVDMRKAKEAAGG
jgi:hypothetical protein